MDKNLIIAILLSTLVIIIFTSPQYQKRFGKNVPQRQVVGPAATDSSRVSAPVYPETAPGLTEKKPPAITTAQEAASDTVTDFSQVNRPEREEIVTLENDDMLLELSSIAGALVNSTMKKYDGPASDERAQLILEGQKWCTGRVVDGDIAIFFSDLNFGIAERSKDSVTFVADLASRGRISRIYSLDPAGYMVHMKTMLEVEKWGSPELSYEWNGPLNDTEAPTKILRIFPFSLFMSDDTTTYMKMAYLGQGDRTFIDHKGKTDNKRIYSNEGAQKVEIKKKDSTAQDSFKGDLDWYAIRNKYFMTAAIPNDPKRWRATSEAQMVTYNDQDRKWFSFTIMKPLSSGDTGLDIYTGPISYDLLKQYNFNLTEVMELSWRLIRPLSIAFLWLIKKIHIVVFNWGLVIIVFSIFIKIILYPLSKSSLKSMHKMSTLQPQINEIREKHKNNQQKQHLLMMELYKREGINPFGGCMPLLLQMPVFFALYPVIGRAFELRNALFIPHWIDDLSRPDPFYILPIAMGISTFFQSKATMKDPNQKAMLYVMPVMMVILFSNFSAGLTLYWFMFNILTSLQQKLVKV